MRLVRGEMIIFLIQDLFSEKRKCLYANFEEKNNHETVKQQKL